MTFLKCHPVRTSWIASAVCFASLAFSLGCSQQDPQNILAAEQGGPAAKMSDSVSDGARGDSPKHHTTFRKASDETSESVQNTKTKTSPEADAADRRPQLDGPDDSQSGPNNSEPQAPEADQSTSHDEASHVDEKPNPPAEGSSESNADRDVTIQEVEKKLQVAEDALEGYIAQQKKRDYQQAAKEKLQDLDKEIAALNDELDDLRQRESVKESHLARIEKKRETFLSELDSLDPTSADDWSDKRRRIDEAWRALQEAQQDGASAEQTSDPGEQEDAADSGTKRDK